MNIFKAFFLTALLIVIELVIYFGFSKLLEPQARNYISFENITHYLRLQNLIAQIVSYLVLFYLFFRNDFKLQNGIENIKTLNFRTIFYLFIIVIGLELFDRPFFDFSKIIDYLKEINSEPLNNSNVSFVRVIGALIVAPIFEELFFRKIIFKQLLKQHSLRISIFVSSFCFAILHLPSYRNLIPTFILGIISCIIYKKTKNINYSIILHFLANLIWLLLITNGESYYKWIFSLEYNFTYWVLFGIGLALTILGLKKITTANNAYNSALPSR